MVIIIWALYLQVVLDFSPSTAGFVIGSISIPLIITSVFTGRIIDKTGPKPIIILGFIFFIISLLGVSIFTMSTDIYYIIISMMIIGLGISLTMISTYVLAFNSLKKEKRGLGTGLLNTARNLGLSLGASILAAILINIQFDKFKNYIIHDVNTKSLNPETFNGLLSKTKSSMNALMQLSAFTQQKVLFFFKYSYKIGFVFANITALIISILCLILIFFWKIKKRKKVKK